MPIPNPKRRFHRCVEWDRPGTYDECNLCKGLRRGWEVEGEEWRPVQLPGISNYLASSRGRVKHKSPGRSPRVPQMRKCGYLRITLLDDSETIRSFDIHQLVAAAFLGPPPPGLQVNHIDCDRMNNRPGNLEYITGRENVAHAIKYGRHNKDRKGLRHRRNRDQPSKAPGLPEPTKPPPR